MGTPRLKYPPCDTAECKRAVKEREIRSGAAHDELPKSAVSCRSENAALEIPTV